MRSSILIVGAGFAGAVYARSLADAGYRVRLVEKRDHIGGNAYDEVDATGIRVHRYGPHLFHSTNQTVIKWMTQFGRWIPLHHRVRALLPDLRLAPLPINRATINTVFGTTFTTAQEVEEHLKRIAEPIAEPKNAAEYLMSRIGKELTELFFRPYSKKMWAMDLEELSAAVVRRIPLRCDDTDTFFPEHETQLMPEGGYTAFFSKLLDHDRIEISLSTPFEKSMLADVFHCFASLPIDEFYDLRYGELPYRSIRFSHRIVDTASAEPHWQDPSDRAFACLNFTDNGPFTRETAWHRLPDHLLTDTGQRVFTREEPCDYRDNFFERYYPVKTADGAPEAIYKRYAAEAALDRKVTFIGRCGTYRYLNMDQVISQSLTGANAWLAAQASLSL